MAARVARVLPPQLALALLLVVCLAAPSPAQRVALSVTGPASSVFSVVDLATGRSTPAPDDDSKDRAQVWLLMAVCSGLIANVFGRLFPFHLISSRLTEIN